VSHVEDAQWTLHDAMSPVYYFSSNCDQDENKLLVSPTVIVGHQHRHGGKVIPSYIPPQVPSVIKSHRIQNEIKS
jgi:hypothetical protein